MTLHGVLDDREAEPRAARAARTRLVGAVEALEDPLLVALGDSDAAIGHGDLDDVVDGLDTHPDVRSLRRVRHGVGDQVAHRFAEHLGVAAHIQSPISAADDLDAGRARLDRVSFGRRRDDLVDGDLALVGELVGGLQPGEVHDARSELREAGRFGTEARSEVAHLVGVVRGRLDRFGEQADRAHRRLQLVARVRDEVAPHLLHALPLGDVAQHEQRQSRRDARRTDDHEARLGRRRAPAEPQRRRRGRLGRAHPAGHRTQVVGGQDVPLREVEGHGRGGRREHGRGRVDHDGRVVHAVQHLADPIGNRGRRLGERTIPCAQREDDHRRDGAPDDRPQKQGEQRELRRIHGSRVEGDRVPARPGCVLTSERPVTIHSRGTVR